MTYKSILQNVVPYYGPAQIGLYHTINEPVYYGGPNSWQVDDDINVDDAQINTSGISSANINILDVLSFQSSYQVSKGVLSGITSSNRLNLQFDPNTAISIFFNSYTTVAITSAGVGTNIIPAIVDQTQVIVGELFVNGAFNIPIVGFGTTVVVGFGTTSVISLASTISSGISSGDTLSFKKSDWTSVPWVNGEGGRMIDLNLANNMVIVGGIATVPIWNFQNFPNQNSKMATITVVGIATQVIAGTGASNVYYSGGNVSAGSSFKMDGEYQYINSNIQNINWSNGATPDFINAQDTLITFRILKDDAGTLRVYGTKEF